jgi:hypothetical protein
VGSSADRTHNLVNEWKRLIATVNHSSLPDVPFCHTLAIGKASFSMDARRTSSIGIKVALTVCVLETFYCFAGVLQAAWLSATPTFPRIRAIKDLEMWGAGTLLSLALAGWCAVSLRRTKHN